MGGRGRKDVLILSFGINTKSQLDQMKWLLQMWKEKEKVRCILQEKHSEKTECTFNLAPRPSSQVTPGLCPFPPLRLLVAVVIRALESVNMHVDAESSLVLHSPFQMGKGLP